MPERTYEQITILDSQQISLYQELPLPLIVLEFKGYATSDVYRKGVSALLKQTQKENINHWLIKCRKGCSITTDDQYWTANEIVPKIAHDLKLDKIAIIEPEDVFTRVSMMSLFEQLGNMTQIEIQFFEKEQNARNWLLNDSDFTL